MSDDRIEYMISKFADGTKVCGAVVTIERRNAIQGDLNWLEKWPHVD